MARYAFIAEAFLKSISNQKIWEKERVEEFRKSIETVLTNFLNELDLAKNNTELKMNFKNKYGHLRPGTYDILAPRYDDNINQINLIHEKTKNQTIQKNNHPSHEEGIYHLTYLLNESLIPLTA